MFARTGAIIHRRRRGFAAQRKARRFCAAPASTPRPIFSSARQATRSWDRPPMMTCVRREKTSHDAMFSCRDGGLAKSRHAPKRAMSISSRHHHTGARVRRRGRTGTNFPAFHTGMTRGLSGVRKVARCRRDGRRRHETSMITLAAAGGVLAPLDSRPGGAGISHGSPTPPPPAMAIDC